MDIATVLRTRVWTAFSYPKETFYRTDRKYLSTRAF